MWVTCDVLWFIAEVVGLSLFHLKQCWITFRKRCLALTVVRSCQQNNKVALDSSLSHVLRQASRMKLAQSATADIRTQGTKRFKKRMRE